LYTEPSQELVPCLCAKADAELFELGEMLSHLMGGQQPEGV
jgi:hypothetical protein